MGYNPEKSEIVFNANDGTGGQALLSITNAPYESAVLLAERLGLKQDGICSWYKWNPVYCLYNDNSEDAEKLRMEMLKLNLPFRMYECMQGSWAWQGNGGIYRSPMWSVDAVIKEIRESAKRYQEQLATTP